MPVKSSSILLVTLKEISAYSWQTHRWPLLEVKYGRGRVGTRKDCSSLLAAQDGGGRVGKRTASHPYLWRRRRRCGPSVRRGVNAHTNVGSAAMEGSQTDSNSESMALEVLEAMMAGSVGRLRGHLKPSRGSFSPFSTGCSLSPVRLFLSSPIPSSISFSFPLFGLMLVHYRPLASLPFFLNFFSFPFLYSLLSYISIFMPLCHPIIRLRFSILLYRLFPSFYWLFFHSLSFLSFHCYAFYFSF